MLFPASYALALVALLLTPVLSIPIHRRHGADIHSTQSAIDKRSMFWGHRHLSEASATMVERNLPAYPDIMAREESSTLETRSFDDMKVPLSKREIQRLVRRRGKKSSPASVSSGNRWFSTPY